MDYLPLWHSLKSASIEISSRAAVHYPECACLSIDGHVIFLIPVSEKCSGNTSQDCCSVWARAGQSEWGPVTDPSRGLVKSQHAVSSFDYGQQFLVEFVVAGPCHCAAEARLGFCLILRAESRRRHCLPGDWQCCSSYKWEFRDGKMSQRESVELRFAFWSPEGEKWAYFWAELIRIKRDSLWLLVYTLWYWIFYPFSILWTMKNFILDLKLKS